MNQRKLGVFSSLLISCWLLIACNPAPAPTASPSFTVDPNATSVIRTPEHLVLATTTSILDSGLLDVILPDFESKFGTDVDVIALDTNGVIALGASGDADVLLIDDPAKADTFVAEEDGSAHYDVMVSNGENAEATFYSIVVVNSIKHPTVWAAMSQQFAGWLTSVETQQVIADYEVNGEPVFTPNSAAWKEAHP